jgi:protein TonB
MAEAGFLEPKRIRPGAATTVILLHTAAIAALLLVKNPDIVTQNFVPTEIIRVATPPPPPPPPPRPDQPGPKQQETVWTATPTPPFRRPIDLPVSEDPPPVPDPGSTASTEDVRGVPYVPPRADPVPDPTPPAAPVRIEPRMVSGDLQPPYPASEQRMEREGSVVIRLTIGSDGRVVGTQKVRATSDAFYEATERHARARWRFRPATLDGRPVEGRKTLTVVFRLDES